MCYTYMLIHPVPNNNPKSYMSVWQCSSGVWEDSMPLICKLKLMLTVFKTKWKFYLRMSLWQNHLPLSFISWYHLQVLTGVDESCYAANSEQLTLISRSICNLEIKFWQIKSSNSIYSVFLMKYSEVHYVISGYKEISYLHGNYSSLLKCFISLYSQRLCAQNKYDTFFFLTKRKIVWTVVLEVNYQPP